MMQHVVFVRSRRRTFFYVLAAVGLTYTSLIGVDELWPRGGVWMLPAAMFVVAALVGVFATVYLIFVLVRPRDRLVINETGILDERFSSNPIRWDDIERVERWQGIRGNFFGLSLKPHAVKT